MPEPVPGSLITVALDGAHIRSELDALVHLGVQIIETDVNSVPLVRERSDLLVQVRDKDWHAAVKAGADLVAVPPLPHEVHEQIRAGGAIPVVDGARAAVCEFRVDSPFGLLGKAHDLPAGTVFFAWGSGAAALPVMLSALACGGHIRTGAAQNPEYAPGEPTRNAAQLAARAVGLAKIAQRPPVSLPDARALLGAACG